jgi:hypothetical protein
MCGKQETGIDVLKFEPFVFKGNHTVLICEGSVFIVVHFYLNYPHNND